LSIDQHRLSHRLHLKDRFLSAHEKSFQSMLYANAITQGQRTERCANEFLLALFRAEDVRITNGRALQVTVRAASRAQSWYQSAGFGTSECDAKLDQHRRRGVGQRLSEPQRVSLGFV
jgi:hypothetical protein